MSVVSEETKRALIKIIHQGATTDNLYDYGKNVYLDGMVDGFEAFVTTMENRAKRYSKEVQKVIAEMRNSLPTREELRFAVFDAEQEKPQ